MSTTIESFIQRIDRFDDLSKSNQIDWFVYYLSSETEEEINRQTIERCFDELDIPPYTNIGQYLNNSKNFYKKNKNDSYCLNRTIKKKFDEILNKPKVFIASDILFPRELLKETRKYIEIVADQAIICYDNGQYDASMVMCRKLIEILIIESFERYKIENRVKDSSDNFFYLSGLISAMENEARWSISRNSRKSLSAIKKIGDLSAHNRRYTAKKQDVDKIKDDFRIVIEELIHLIDYPSWKVA